MRKPATKLKRPTAVAVQRVVGRMNRLSIRFNGKEMIGATVSCERPKNSDEMTALLRELIAMREAPDVADPEVLGKYSPNDEVSGGATGAPAATKLAMRRPSALIG